MLLHKQLMVASSTAVTMPLMLGQATSHATPCVGEAGGVVLILDDVGMTAFSVCGAVFGAIASFAFFRQDHVDPDSATRNLAMKFIACAAMGFYVTPLAFRYFEWTPDVDTVGGSSFLLSLMAVCIAHALAKHINRRAEVIP